MVLQVSHGTRLPTPGVGFSEEWFPSFHGGFESASQTLQVIPSQGPLRRYLFLSIWLLIVFFNSKACLLAPVCSGGLFSDFLTVVVHILRVVGALSFLFRDLRSHLVFLTVWPIKGLGRRSFRKGLHLRQS